MPASLHEQQTVQPTDKKQVSCMDLEENYY